MPAALNRHPDVLVVGGGVIGLTTAVFCRRAGLGRVLVIDAARLATGPSGAAGGALAPELHRTDDPLAFVALARASLALYRQLDQEWDGALRLRWTPGLILLPEDPADRPRPWPEVELVTADRIAELAPDLTRVPAALLVRQQAQVHPLRLAVELARRAGSVATGLAMTGLDTAGGRVTTVHTTAGELRPGVVVFATGLAPNPWVRLPQRLVKGHLVALEPDGCRLHCSVHSPGLGVGPMPDGSLLAGGTRDEGDSSPEARPQVVERIRQRVGELLPVARTARLRHAWCCFRPATADGQPVIDRVPGITNAWVSAGHNGTGLLMAPATGQSLADWIATGERPQQLASFGLSRFGPEVH